MQEARCLTASQSTLVKWGLAQPRINQIKLGDFSLHIRKEHSSSRSLFLTAFSNKRNQGYWEKWVILRLGQEICKMSLEPTEVPESKKVTKQRNKENKTIAGSMSKELRSHWKEVPVGKTRTI